MTETQTQTVKLDKIFEPLPDPIKASMATLPTPLNANERDGKHMSPRMGRLVRAFRVANGNMSQKALAEQQFADAGFRTTHCQIATLEQGGCKKGANEQTVKLLAHALKVKPELIEAINKADLEERAKAGDAQAKKILGIADEEDKTPSATAGKEATKEGDETAKPAPTPAAKKTATAPSPKPEPSKEKASTGSK